MYPDYHVHLNPDEHVHQENGPYSTDWALRFIEEAERQGICEVGFVEHGYRFIEAKHLLEIEWAKEWCTERTMDFVDQVLHLKSKGYPVKLGLEMDYVEGKEAAIQEYLEQYPWDFVIGAVHWDILPDGTDFPFEEEDGPWPQETAPAIYDRFFHLVEKAVSSGLFDILAHLDYVKARPLGACDHHIQRVMRRISETGMCMEVNTGGESSFQDTYPPERLMQYACDKGIPVATSSDAHYPEYTGFMIEETAKKLWKAGYRNLATFHERNRLDIPLVAE